jgi:hypothetical protein
MNVKDETHFMSFLQYYIMRCFFKKDHDTLYRYIKTNANIKRYNAESFTNCQGHKSVHKANRNTMSLSESFISERSEEVPKIPVEIVFNLS